MLMTEADLLDGGTGTPHHDGRHVDTYPCIVCAGRCCDGCIYMLSGYASESDGEDQQETVNKKVDVEAEDENHTNF
jgi:hypothetical protein